MTPDQDQADDILTERIQAILRALHTEIASALERGLTVTVAVGTQDGDPQPHIEVSVDREPTSWQLVAAAAIAADISDRRGLGDAWDLIDRETQREIVTTWAQRIWKIAQTAQFGKGSEAASTDAAKRDTPRG
jgi:hypothetical protein